MEYLEEDRAGTAGGGREIESLGCRYRGLVWDGVEQGAELGGWDGVTNN